MAVRPTARFCLMLIHQYGQTPPPIMRFARTLHRDIDAVRNAIELPWSNGQAEGQINRLKTLKRVMYDRAGPELLRAQILPLRHTD